MCGIIAVAGFRDVIQDLYDGLILLQHRGQDAAGIITYNSQFHLKKANGLVQDVFHDKSLLRLRGTMGIGHVRYPTAGCSSEFEAQPFFVSTPFGIALAHNGNLTNAAELRTFLLEKEYRHLNTNSDSEVLLNVLSVAIRNQRPKGRLTPDQIFSAMKNVFKRCKGAYSAVALIGGQGIVGFRDPHGIRPLQIGKRKFGMKEEYIIASENSAFPALDFEFVRDVRPGEVVFIDHKNRLHSHQVRHGELSPCIFEWVYLAAPDSTLDGVNVYKARVRMGEALARQIKKAGIHIDSVVPVPDTGRPVAAGLAGKLNVHYREGLIKNRYIHRTFIMPGQSMRKRSLHFKLHPIELEFKGKSVLLVDDSIVRGNTSKKIVELVREAGAKKVYFASAAPPIISPDPYGIDLPTTEELIGSKLSVEEIRKYIKADGLFYGTIDDLHKAIWYGNPRIKRFSEGCFTKKYPTPEVTPKLLRELGNCRNSTRESFQHDDEEGDNQKMLALV
ncbi:MAG TPA: amidophosphoribosyltransferase [Candidatus Peribacter riflensis]|uniref:Amidophosphoribosyltransferase n=1 Tax=Candidatus Peribacter riflensis TaxID=1735162 RepID=A0A0S1SSG8_9BACT|nr:MAG: amidophosphoribosyltransferase [Candidatus Peribacter riflensis]ALM10856.1 MAG: amidophosphoribosyltransferase [Candidatus Peribacter riflensis]ALM11958.1 MAG: amidophosphoribosyltransferase [Candidatus Peribacter riflensis]ALM13061.1 MAG: amidophosphoribosyltransferase [Candidatus Peribacter riflensis]ALM14161.1 MAG: amidophosphoribosyltransferase [Candidatus Peribacter riflensis]